MTSHSLNLSWAPERRVECDCLLIIPERALQEHGYIKTLHRSAPGNKHEFQALAQTGYYQFQDGELELWETPGTIEVVYGTAREALEDGMVLVRGTDGAIGAVMHRTGRAKKLLEAAHRFCTRWVRLDI